MEWRQPAHTLQAPTTANGKLRLSKATNPEKFAISEAVAAVAQFVWHSKVQFRCASVR